jgi:hypothetical protein
LLLWHQQSPDQEVLAVLQVLHHHPLLEDLEVLLPHPEYLEHQSLLLDPLDQWLLLENQRPRQVLLHLSNL